MSEYIRTNKFDTNECLNIFVKEKLIRTNIRIYIRDQYIRIFEYSNIFVTLCATLQHEQCNSEQLGHSKQRKGYCGYCAQLLVRRQLFEIFRAKQCLQITSASVTQSDSCNAHIFTRQTNKWNSQTNYAVEVARLQWWKQQRMEDARDNSTKRTFVHRMPCRGKVI